MKKVITKLLMILITVSLIMPINGAAIGSVAGTVQPADIKTYLFGELINSYNIGGRTIILCEDLNWFYGFDVIWDGEARTLNVNSKYSKYRIPGESGQPDISQNIKNLPADYYTREAPTKIYTTDIKTYLDGKQITAYNVGGKTAIICEDMRDYGYNVVWNETERTLSISLSTIPTYAPSDIGTVILSGEMDKDSMYNFQYSKTHMSLNGKQADVNSITPYLLYPSFYQLNEICNFANLKYEWDGQNLAIYTDGGEFDEFEHREYTVLEPNIIDTVYSPYIKSITVDGYPAKLTYWRGYMMGSTPYRSDDITAYVYKGSFYLPSSFYDDIVTGYFTTITDSEVEE